MGSGFRLADVLLQRHAAAERIRPPSPLPGRDSSMSVEVRP